MKKIFKTSDGRIYMNVTEKAEKLFSTHMFDLYVVWEKEDKTFRLPVTDRQDIAVAMEYNKSIAIEIASIQDVIDLIPMRPDKWEKADKLLHNGFIYIRYDDLF
jgi:hypothetical protein